MSITAERAAAPFPRHPNVLAASLLFTGLVAMMVLLPVGAATPDMVNALIPWMDAVRAEGLSSISGEFAIYTPPYIYLLYLGSWLVPMVGTLAAIKLINAPFVAMVGVAVYDLVTRATGETRRATLAGMAACTAPTVLVNAFGWGQADVIYTSFMVLSVAFACRDAPARAAVMFGVAVAFKLQAIFISPLLLYLVLSRRMQLWQLALVPLTFLAMMAPAWLAGRGWTSILMTYVWQSGTFRKLAVSAPNPWFFVDYLFVPPPKPVYLAGVAVGLSLAAVAGLVISLRALRLRPGARTSLLVATLCAGLMPYLLPKMHDRYFFPADVLSVAFVFVFPRYWPVALLFQLGSLITYSRYFGFFHDAPAIGFVAVTLAVGALLVAFRAEQSARPAAGMGLRSSPES